MPKIYDYSECEKDLNSINNKNRVEILDILMDKENYIIQGKEYVGKTTLLRYLFIKSQEFDKIPLYVDFKDLQYDSTNLLYKVLNNLSNSNISVDLTSEIENGNCMVLIDNVFEDNKYFEHIRLFSEQYPNNKIILTEKESNYRKLLNIKEEFDNKTSNDNFKKLYIHSFGIRELRSMISKWFPHGEVDEYNIFNTMSNIILTNKLPRNPLIYSLFLGIIEKDSTFIPVNTASLFDKFSDIYLGKINIFPQMDTNYGYSIKLIFLEELAKYMIDNNVSSISYDEYTLFANKFNEEKTKVIATKLLDDLLKSNFIIYQEEIAFSNSCFMFFFYAKYCVRHSAESVLIDNIDTLKFTYVIDFYSGLLVTSETILEECTMSMLDKAKIDVDRVDCYINKYYRNNKIWQCVELSCDTKSDSDINKEYDTRAESYSSLEKEIDKIQDTELSDKKINVIGSLILVCSVLKNSECVSRKLRKEVLQYCLDYFVWGLSELLSAMENYIKKEKDGKEMEKNLFKFITFLTIMMQEITSQTLGSTVLEDEIKNIDVSNKNIIYEFLICMITTDLNINGYIRRLEKFVKSEENIILLQCTKFKLENVFIERNFFDNNKDEMSILTLIKNIMKKIHKDEKINSKQRSLEIDQKLDEEITKHITNLKRRKSIYRDRRLQ